MIWYETQNIFANAVGIVLIIGCVTYSVGIVLFDKTTVAKAKYKFWIVNIWLISFIPLSMFLNIVLYPDYKIIEPYLL